MPDDLSPDVIQSRLSTSWLGQPMLLAEEVDSTNTQISRLARQGGSHGTVLVANSQTRGRGRLARSWHSPSGLNLYFSVLLRPKWPAGTTQPISLAAGVALAEAIELLLAVKPELKWPNDLLWNGQKLAGILVESATGNKNILYLVLGIGLNVNQQQFPRPLDSTATSLRLAAGKMFQRADVLATVLNRLEHWIDYLSHDGREAVVETWLRFAPWINRQITVRNGGQQVTGKAVGLESSGALQLQDELGSMHSIVSGDVSLRE